LVGIGGNLAAWDWVSGATRSRHPAGCWAGRATPVAHPHGSRGEEVFDMWDLMVQSWSLWEMMLYE